MSVLVRSLVAFAVVATAAPRAFAEPGGNIDLNVFRPAIDSRGYLTVNASQVLGDVEVSFGLGALDWGYKLLKFDANGSEYNVNHMVAATLIGAFGKHLGPLELELAVSVPLTIVFGDRDPDFVDPANSNNNRDFKIDGQGIGNLGLHLKTRFIKTSRPPHVGLGVIASVFLDTTDPKKRWLGEDQVVPQFMGILDKEFGRDGRLRMAINAGIRLRKTRTFTDDGAGEDAADRPATTTNETITASNEIPFGFGVAYALSKGKFDVVGEVFGAVPLGDKENYQPLEALLGLKVYLARNSFLSLGGGRGLIPGKGGSPDARAMIGIVFEPNIGDRDGDGLKDDVDKCPDDPEDFDRFEDEDGCPEPDNDRDGILDEDDKCPNIPEDKDGFQDEDGCPELDNDQDKILDVDDLCPNDPEDYDQFEDEDGCPDNDNDKDRILDKLDKCPNEPEEYNNFEDEDGCPDRHGAKLTESGIVTLEPINFEYNKAIIKKDSFYILDAVVASLQGNPDITLLEIQGHTDERGDDAYNLDLSIRRAAAVLKYLTDHGVDADRLESQGYGETMPVDKSHTERAWAKNRRVDFLILKRATK